MQWTAPPGSLFLYRAGVPDDPAHRFDFFVPNIGTDFIALRANDIFAMCVFGDNGHWRRALGGSPAETACQQVSLHPAQCTEAMLRVYTLMEAYRSSGCFDMIELGEGDRTLRGGIQRVFHPQFTVKPSGVPTAVLDVAFVNTFFQRSFGTPAPRSVIAAAGQGRLPTCLRNPSTDQPVQAQCYEPGCPDVLLRAGWDLGASGRPCDRCGADGS